MTDSNDTDLKPHSGRFSHNNFDKISSSLILHYSTKIKQAYIILNHVSLLTQPNLWIPKKHLVRLRMCIGAAQALDSIATYLTDVTRRFSQSPANCLLTAGRCLFLTEPLKPCVTSACKFPEKVFLPDQILQTETKNVYYCQSEREFLKTVGTNPDFSFQNPHSCCFSVTAAV